MRSKTDAWEWSPYEQKKAGLWIKGNSKPHPSVMAVDFRPAFYAEGKHIPLSNNNFNNITDIQTEALSKQVDFIVIDSRNLRNNSQLMDLIKEPKDSSDFEPVFQDTENENYKIVIYRLKRRQQP